jgi:hypothetical protein
VELEQQRRQFEARGLGIVAITYDSPELVKHFAQRKGLTYPVLGDGEFKMIRAFNILNDNFPPDHAWYGVPFPGTYVTDENGIVREKFFEPDHRERYTAHTVLVKTGAAAPGGWQEVETAHLKLRYGASEAAVRPGNLISLVLEIELKPRMHVYAPGVQSAYIPIRWSINASKAWLAHEPAFPASRILHLEAINEQVPVYENRIRLARDLTIGQSGEILPVLDAEKGLKVNGAFRYQACDDKVCYTPVTLPLEWSFATDNHDSQRAPEHLQRRRNP